jgi:hypothetical protein
MATPKIVAQVCNLCMDLCGEARRAKTEGVAMKNYAEIIDETDHGYPA